jgi:hypothetical protein
MTTPILLIMPKIIVALGESIDVVDTGICTNVEFEDVDSGFKMIARSWGMIGGDGIWSR